MAFTALDSIIPIENTGQIGVLLTSILCFVIPATLVALRIISKRLICMRVDWSDYCILAALIFVTGISINLFVLVFKGGFGFHVTVTSARFGADSPVVFYQCIFAFALIWNATICFSKLSVLLMYTAVLPVRKIIITSRVLGGFIIIWNFAGILAGLLLCHPLAMNWNSSIPGGYCGNQKNYWFSLGTLNVISDVLILCLPMPVLYGLQLSRSKKLFLMGMFSIGFMTCVITIYRQVTLPSTIFTDMSYSGLLATVLSAIEPAVAICLACVPFLRPVFRWARRMPQHDNTNHEFGGTKAFSKKNRTPRSGDSRDFEELNDDSSEIQLRPFNYAQHARVTVQPNAKAWGNEEHGSECIIVKTKWEVDSEL